MQYAGIIDDIVNRIVATAKPKQVILFGSYAYGEPNRDSDIDIIVVKETQLPFNKRAADIRRSLRDIIAPIDVLVYTPEEVNKWKDCNLSFLGSVTAKGKVLYEK